MLRKIVLSSIVLALTACNADSRAEAQSKSAANSDKAPAQTQTVKKDITTEALGDNMYMLLGPGGNIGVSVGDDGVFIIDDKFARFADQIISEIKGVTDQPIRYVVNTHYHGDHSGANAQMKEVGATIMAHDNVRKRMGLTLSLIHI